jgi:transposase
VIVANPRSVRLISECSRKDDKLDARMLARLARIDPQLLSPIRHRSEQAQADLMSIRARAAMVEMRTALINTARGLVKSNGERLPSCSSYQVCEELAGSLPVALQAALRPLLGEIDSLTERIREYDEQLDEMSKERYPEVRY